jgi:hypothetical protein
MRVVGSIPKVLADGTRREFAIVESRLDGHPVLIVEGAPFAAYRERRNAYLCFHIETREYFGTIPRDRVCLWLASAAADAADQPILQAQRRAAAEAYLARRAARPRQLRLPL